MKGLLSSVVAKVIALILNTIAIAAFLLFGFVTVFLEKHGAYSSSYVSVQASVCKPSLISLGTASVDLYRTYGADAVRDTLAYTNVRILMTDSSGNVLVDTRDDEPVRFTVRDLYDYTVMEGDHTPVFVQVEIELSVTEELAFDDDISRLLGLLNVAYEHIGVLPVLTVVSFALCAAVSAFLVCGAGHKRGVPGIALGFADRIPLEPFILLHCALFLPAAYLNVAAGAVIAFTLCYLTSLSVLRSVIVRAKAGTLFRNAIVYKLGRWLLRRLRSLFAGIPLIPLFSGLIISFTVLEFFFVGMAVSAGSEAYFIVWLLLMSASSVLALFAAMDLAKLKRGVERIASGELDYRLETANMHGRFKQIAGSLNEIGVGMSRAVDERLRSERLRTELITNVSHDIKTPLTSIINYVDLIRKRGSGDEQTAEYINVLDRQSARLRKLVDDLLEASKASTGNIAVELEKCDLCLLMEQTIGEYRQRLAERGIEPVVSLPDKPVNVLADGRHMWRVIDNLLGNVIKYAQPGTRLYVDVGFAGGSGDAGADDAGLPVSGTVTMRNISAAALNVSGEELMERFVRGDGSRHTEGSGLGLSIARSLMELQGGRLDITVDGDLFKTSVTLNAL